MRAMRLTFALTNLSYFLIGGFEGGSTVTYAQIYFSHISCPEYINNCVATTVAS